MPHPSASETTQQKLIMEYLGKGRELTSLVALTNLGVGSLSSRIAELRAHGHKIVDTWGEDHFGRRYKKYTLETT